MPSNTRNHLAESHVGTTRAAIKADLVDRIIYNGTAVFKRLRIDQVDRNFVASLAPCAASFNVATEWCRGYQSFDGTGRMSFKERRPKNWRSRRPLTRQSTGTRRRGRCTILWCAYSTS
ncbi:hypothetical protein M378DRAFT_171794 [Amanita muscaria Koide BX008]|uniref:Uncharacterized protein n=1 Tax=Amanita muscaria (strain Koide BX008) TaxID=946122 RepID=A0A0C2S407_AMAMK|nr:hypothetical protein M378DRAFT_171794 [Amanita muscaria Koide BX008]